MKILIALGMVVGMIAVVIGCFLLVEWIDTIYIKYKNR